MSDSRRHRRFWVSPETDISHPRKLRRYPRISRYVLRKYYTPERCIAFLNGYAYVYVHVRRVSLIQARLDGVKTVLPEVAARDYDGYS